MNFKEYIHAREHVGMGCGTMQTCALCNQRQLGEAAPSIFTGNDLKKLLIMSTLSTIIGGIVSEMVRRAIFRNKTS